jgi:quercetin dioxygenase-like cupin family protein
MRSRTIGFALLGAATLAAAADAQTTPAPSAIARTVVAATKLPTVTDLPLYFGAASVTVPPGAASSVSAANGILYQISGSTEVSIDGDAQTLSAGEGSFIAGGKTASLKAGSAQPSTFLHFLLTPAAVSVNPPRRHPPP